MYVQINVVFTTYTRNGQCIILKLVSMDIISVGKLGVIRVGTHIRTYTMTLPLYRFCPNM